MNTNVKVEFEHLVPFILTLYQDIYYLIHNSVFTFHMWTLSYKKKSNKNLKKKFCHNLESLKKKFPFRTLFVKYIYEVNIYWQLRIDFFFFLFQKHLFLLSCNIQQNTFALLYLFIYNIFFFFFLFEQSF